MFKNSAGATLAGIIPGFTEFVDRNSSSQTPRQCDSLTAHAAAGPTLIRATSWPKWDPLPEAVECALGKDVLVEEHEPIRGISIARDDDRSFAGSLDEESLHIATLVSGPTSTTVPDKSAVSDPYDDAATVRIPTSKYTVGTAGKYDHPMVGLPKSQVDLASFAVDRTEVTIASHA